MEWFVKAFIKASLGWLAGGVTLGGAMAMHPPWAAYRLAHVHMLLLGFVAMMIFGVAYHVMPRFSGHALHSRRAASAHWWAANVGLALMVAGFVLRSQGIAAATVVLGAGAACSAAGAYTFAWVLWRTVDGPAPLRGHAATAARRVRQAERAGLPLAATSVHDG